MNLAMTGDFFAIFYKTLNSFTRTSVLDKKVSIKFARLSMMID